MAQITPGGGRARLILPIYWTQIFWSTILLEGEAGGRAKLLYGAFEMPLMLLPGQKPATVICIYALDINYEVIVFDLAARRHHYAPVRGEEDLSRMVLDSELPFRRADRNELRYALAAVRAMPEGAYESASVPTLDLGWYRWYAYRQGIEKIVEDRLQEEGRSQ